MLDNLEDVLREGRSVSRKWGLLLWALVEREHRSQVVITSREVPKDLADPRDFSGVPNPSVVRVETIYGIDQTASVKLLKDVGLRDSDADLEWVAQRVDGLVQVLTLLRKWSRKPGKLRQDPDLVTSDARPILQAQLARQSEGAIDLLKQMCVLQARIEIEGLTFLRLYQDGDNRFQIATETKKPAELLPEEIEETQVLVDVLVNCSLVQGRYNEQHYSDFYDLHRVIAEFMRKEYQSELPELIKNGLIFNSHDISNVARRDSLIFLVEDISQNRKVSLSANYQVGFDPSDRDRVASAFASSKSFTDEIDKKLKTWTAQFIERIKPEYFIDRYAIQVIELQNNLYKRAKTEVGLKLDFQIQLEKQEQLRSISIGTTKQPVPLTVRVKDCGDELQLRVRTDLNYDESNIIKAVLHSLPGQELTIVNLVIKKIKEFLVESVTINEFSYELKTIVRDNLAVFLNHNLLDYGRKVEFLSLESDAITIIPQEIIEITYIVTCRVQGYSKPVKINNSIQLLPKDLSMFRKTLPANQKVGEESPLNVWVKRKLDKIVTSLLLHQCYIDILTRFSPISLAIKTSIENEVKTIGFSTENIILAPDLEHLELTHEFTLDDKEGCEYLTNSTNIKVKLNTAVTARIVDFTKIEAYLDASIEDIKTLMQSAIQGVIQEKLSNVVPARYYVRFYHNDQGRSLEEEIEKIIIKKLTESFGAEVKSVAVRPIDTAIVTYYRELR